MCIEDFRWGTVRRREPAGVVVDEEPGRELINEATFFSVRRACVERGSERHITPICFGTVVLVVEDWVAWPMRLAEAAEERLFLRDWDARLARFAREEERAPLVDFVAFFAAIGGLLGNL